MAERGDLVLLHEPFSNLEDYRETDADGRTFDSPQALLAWLLGQAHRRDVFLKDTTDRQWDNDPGMKAYLEFMTKDFPEGDKLDNGTVVGYGVAQTLVQVLKQCGDDLTRENVMKQAASLKDFRTEVLLPGISINTSPTDFAPISQLQLMRFKGEKWELFGDVISGDVGG